MEMCDKGLTLARKAGGMALKNRFVGVRLEPEQQRKLILLSVKAGEPGNMSAGLRWALEQVKVSGTVSAEVLQQAEREEAVCHA